MSGNFVQSTVLRAMALSGLQMRARSMVWRRGPRIFVNSLPKAGTHLATSLLGQHPQMVSSYCHILTQEVDRSGGAQAFQIDQDRLSLKLRRIRGGQFVTSHLPFDADCHRMLLEEDFRIVNIVRDPRDVLISMLHYISGLKRHRLHRLLTTEYSTDRERAAALLAGFSPEQLEEYGVSTFPYAMILGRFVGWANASDVLTLRFEDLAGPRGGGSAESQLNAISALFEHTKLDPETDRVLTGGSHKKTATLRKGIIGEWRDFFDEPLLAEVNAASSNWLDEFGYGRG